MASRYIDKVTSLSFLNNLPDAAGFGVFNGVPYINAGSGYLALGSSLPNDNWFVDGDDGADTNGGTSWADAFKTIATAISAAGQGDRVYIKALEGDSASGDTDPDSYTENLTITAKDGLSLIGVSRGLAQGAQPQIKVGTTTTDPILTVNSFGCSIHNLTFNGAGATGGIVKLVANGSTADAGGFVAQGCHFKNAKSTGNASTGGAIYWTTSGGAWYVSIYGNEFIDCRCGIAVLGSGVSVPRHVKIVGNRFGAAANTSVDADIFVATGGVLDLMIIDNDFATVDVPAYATSPAAARYLSLGTGTAGLVARNTFACIADPAGTEVTFGAAGTAAIIPTTVRMAQNFGEGVVATADQSIIGRT